LITEESTNTQGSSQDKTFEHAAIAHLHNFRIQLDPSFSQPS